jgi:hypothetical protein
MPGVERCSARCSGRNGLGGTGILHVYAPQPTGKMPVPPLARYRDSGFALADRASTTTVPRKITAHAKRHFMGRTHLIKRLQENSWPRSLAETFRISGVLV